MKIYQRIKNYFLSCYWLLIAILGYLTGLAIYFLSFRVTSLDQFISQGIFSHEKLFISTLLIIISFYLFCGYFFRVNIEKNFGAIIGGILCLFIGFYLRTIPIIGEYLYVIILSLSITLFASASYLSKLQKIFQSKYAIFILFGLFTLIYSFHTIMKHVHFYTMAYDLGIYSQAFYKYSHFDFFSQNTIRGIANLWGDHFNLILIPLSLLYNLYPHPPTMLVIQALIVVSAIFPLYFLTNDILKNRASAFFICLAYLLFFGLQNAIDFDFHLITLAPTFYLLTFYLAYKNKWGWYFLSLILLLCCKEDVSLFVVFLGIFIFFWKKNWKAGITTAILGAVWFVVVTMIIIPHYSPVGFVYLQYSNLGQTPLEIVKNILVNPLYAWHLMFNETSKQVTLMSAFGSFGFLSIFAPTFLFLAIPMLGENLWNDASSRWYCFQYGIAFLPAFTIAAVYGITNFVKVFNLKKETTYLFLSFFIFLCSLLVGINDRVPLLNLFKKSTYVISSDVRDTNKIISEIPKNASVTTQHSMVSHLTNRELIFQYPGQDWPQAKNADYYAFSLVGAEWPWTRKEEIQVIKDFLNRSDYGLVERINGAYLFKRGEKTNSDEYNKAIDYLNNYKIPE